MALIYDQLPDVRGDLLNAFVKRLDQGDCDLAADIFFTVSDHPDFIFGKV